jgi:hypothetical protein
MLDLMRENPWLIVVCGAFLIPIFGIVFGTVTQYLTKVRTAELEASLKQEMLQKGMSAEEIRTVIEATAQRKGKKCYSDSVARRERV